MCAGEIVCEEERMRLCSTVFVCVCERERQRERDRERERRSICVLDKV